MKSKETQNHAFRVAIRAYLAEAGLNLAEMALRAGVAPGLFRQKLRVGRVDWPFFMAALENLGAKTLSVDLETGRVTIAPRPDISTEPRQ